MFFSLFMKKILMLLIPLFLLVLSFKFIFIFWAYSVEQKEMMDYLEGNGKLGKDYSEKEVSHMVDVKRVIFWFNVIFYFISCVALIIFFLLIKNREKYFTELLLGGIFTILLIGGLFLMVSLNFDLLFNRFHRILFFPQTWVFNPDSKLLQLFPEEFFINFVRRVIFLSGLLGVLITILGSFLKYYLPKKS